MRNVWPVVVFLFFLNILSASALATNIPSEWWKQEAIQKNIGLTEKQIRGIDTLFETWSDERKAILQKIATFVPSIQDAVLKNLDENKLNSMLDEYFDLRKQIFLKNIKMRKTVKALMTREQVEKLLADYPKMFSLSTQWQKNRNQRTERKKGNVIIKREGEK